MTDARRVDGLDVRPGQLLRHRGIVFKVTAAARKKVGRQIVNTVQVQRLDNGKRGYVDLPQGTMFTVGKPGGTLTDPENQTAHVSKWASGEPG